MRGSAGWRSATGTPAPLDAPGSGNVRGGVGSDLRDSSPEISSAGRDTEPHAATAKAKSETAITLMPRVLAFLGHFGMALVS